MPLHILPLTPPDIPTLVRIQLAAFNTGIASSLAPSPAPESYILNSIEKHKKSMQEPDVTYMKCIDTDAGDQMIAVAKWRINLEERGQEEVNRMLPWPGKEEEGNGAAEVFMRYLRWARGTYMGGKPFVFLHMLATDPSHQGRGAGALLVNWGLELADKHQLPSFLEASQAGKPLYIRLGFVPQHEEVFDLTQWGGEGKDSNTAMIRPPILRSSGSN